MRQASRTTIVLLIALASSGCASNDGAGPDSGTDTGSGDTETVTDTGPYTSDAGPWDWEDLPPGEDCGPGCTQVAVSPLVGRGTWDVWDGLLVYVHDNGNMFRTCVIELHQMKRMFLPDVLQDHPEAEKGNAGRPTVSGNHVFYRQYGLYPWPNNNKRPLFFVHADLENKVQTIIWQTELESGIPGWSTVFDSYGQRVVSEGGYDCPGAWTCVREPPWPSNGVNLPGCTFGLSIWGDRVVCMNLNDPPDDILAYDLAAMESFPVTADDHYQIWPRIHEDRVVWQDFRLGSGEPAGSWEHSAIFTKDLSTGEVKQITDGSAIASYPDVFGDRIVWTDYRHCANPHDKNAFSCIEVYGYNFATQTEFRVTDLPGRAKSLPRIWGERVFVSMRTLDGESGIYMFDLPAEAR